MPSAPPAPTRPGRRWAALGKVTSFDAGGLIPQENPSANVPADCWLLAQVKNGSIVRVSPTPPAGFVCSPGGYLAAPGFQPETR